MNSHRITGGGGIQLHLVETGNPRGRPILFLHGFSQCWMSFSRQLSSDLADDHRLVAMDMRGHGLSDKPRDAYGDSKLWADDIEATIEALGLDQPILCGWSYGPLVILDYIRHYGEDRIGGMHFVGGISKVGSDEAMSVIGAEFACLIPGFFSSSIEEGLESVRSLVRLIVPNASAEEQYLMQGYMLAVPPYVRQGLFARSLDNDDLLPTLRKPVLVTHSADDAIITPAIVEHYRAKVPHAQIHMMATGGHMPFWHDAAGFNQRLRQFAASVPDREAVRTTERIAMRHEEMSPSPSKQAQL